MKYSFALAALFAGSVAAQSACIVQCSTQAATDNCDGVSFTDTACACENAGFQAAALQCLQSTCTAEEQQQALQLQQTLCGASSGSATGSASEPAETESATASDPEETATAPLSSVVASVTSRASSAIASVTSRTASVVASASSNIASRTSTAGAATSSAPANNGASGLAAVNLAAAGTWAAVALGGAVVAQYAL